VFFFFFQILTFNSGKSFSQQREKEERSQKENDGSSDNCWKLHKSHKSHAAVLSIAVEIGSDQHRVTSTARDIALHRGDALLPPQRPRRTPPRDAWPRLSTDRPHPPYCNSQERPPPL